MKKLWIKIKMLLVWYWLYKNPDKNKKDLPPVLFSLIKHSRYWCPLCDLFYVHDLAWRCASIRCPLSKAGERCDWNKSYYVIWRKHRIPDGDHSEAQAAALGILKIIWKW